MWIAENWNDFDAELFDSLYNDDSGEREFNHKIYGADISPKAVDIAMRNIKSAGVARYIDLQVKPISQWTEAPANGVIVTNPPYGERLLDIKEAEELYRALGKVLKMEEGRSFNIISPHDEFESLFGRKADKRRKLYNGMIKCQLYMYYSNENRK